MEQHARLKARIANLEELRELIRAMRATAAARVQEAQEALAGVRHYAEIIEDAINRAAALAAHAPSAPGSAGAARGGRALVVACSEHGFAGAFNDRLLDRAGSELGPGETLGVVGRRGAARAEERGIGCAWTMPAATHAAGVLATARGVARRLGDAAEVKIIFGRYRKGGHVAAEAQTILPLPRLLLKRAFRGDLPLHHIAPPALLDRLAGEYVLAEIARALMESLASENGARLMVMEAADRNIEDKRTDLRRLERTARQEAVTSELIDIVVGAEAVLGQEA